MILTYKPIVTWPGDLTQHRTEAQFSMLWERTLRLLGEEVDRVAHPPHGEYHAHAVIHLAVSADDLRKDGHGLRAGARFYHPGVVLTFDDAEGRELRFHCDRYTRTWGHRQPWRDNAHAIYLTLKALRDLDRWGAVAPGQQYRGFRAALGSGIAVGTEAPPMTPSEAAAYLAEATEGLHHADEIAASLTVAEETYRVAAHMHHPDRPGGNAVIFSKVADAIAVLRKASS